MDVISSGFTVLFEDPFWVGVYERQEQSVYQVCKITFGAEPKDYEVYEFLLRNWHRLRFSPGVVSEQEAKKRRNPKRLQREIHRQVKETGIGTKAQQALQLQHEQGKALKKQTSKERRELERERQFALRQEKRKEKHKGH